MKAFLQVLLLQFEVYRHTRHGGSEAKVLVPAADVPRVQRHLRYKHAKFATIDNNVGQ